MGKRDGSWGCIGVVHCCAAWLHTVACQATAVPGFGSTWLHILIALAGCIHRPTRHGCSVGYSDRCLTSSVDIHYVLSWRCWCWCWCGCWCWCWCWCGCWCWVWFLCMYMCFCFVLFLRVQPVVRGHVCRQPSHLVWQRRCGCNSKWTKSWMARWSARWLLARRVVVSDTPLIKTYHAKRARGVQFLSKGRGGRRPWEFKH